MAILKVSATTPLLDGRQSERAIQVRRGVQLMLQDLRLASLAEMTLASGRRADLVALSDRGDLTIIEIKSSVEDFRVDRKWPEYRAHCDRLFFATLPDVPSEIFPADCGLILSDGYGAQIVRDAPEHRISAATRKSMLVNFSRTAAQRLTRAEWTAHGF